MVDRTSNSQTNSDKDAKYELTPAEVRQVSEKVYQLFLQELKRDNERRRVHNPHYRR